MIELILLLFALHFAEAIRLKMNDFNGSEVVNLSHFTINLGESVSCERRMILLAFKNIHLKFPELSVDLSFIHKLHNTCIFSGNVFFIADVRRFRSF